MNAIQATQKRKNHPEYQGLHPDGLSVSVYRGFIIYVLTFAALFNGRNALLICVLLKWNRTQILRLHGEIFKYMCNSYVTW